MDRRGFLALGAASAALAGCGAAPPPWLDAVAETFPPEGAFVRAAGLDIHAWDRGEGTPVILLHGASGNLRDWTFGLAPLIAARHRAIAFDRPGNGWSGRPAGDAGDPAVQARILREAARALGAGPAVLVGHSWGAALAMAWALAYPDEVLGVVSVSGTVMPWSERPMLAELVGLDRLLIRLYFDWVLSSGGIARFVERIFRPQPVPDGYLQHIGGQLAMRPATVAANMQDIAALNPALRRMAPDYGRLDIPVEILSGTEDFILDPEAQPVPFAAALRRPRLTLLPGIGHMAHHAAPDEVLAAIARIDPRA